MPIPDHENCQSPEDIALAAADVGLGASVAMGIEDALLITAGDEQPVRVLITGSLYLAGHILKLHRGFAVKPSG